MRVKHNQAETLIYTSDKRRQGPPTFLFLNAVSTELLIRRGSIFLYGGWGAKLFLSP
jgi:hypothetical protein